MNLHLLRIFFNVAREGSFSRAAEALHISQPAVSKGVRELEHQLDVALVERAQRQSGAKSRVMLTPIGEVLFEHARGIFALEKAAIDDIHARVGLRKGALVVGASTTIAGYWLGPYLALFADAWPDIAIEVRAGNTESVSRWLIDCEVDVALVEGAVADERLESRHWEDDALVIIGPPDWEQSLPGSSLDALNGERWVLREPGSGTREVTRQMMADLKIAPASLMEAGSNEAIARSVACGAGLAIVPRVVAADLLELGRVTLIEPPAMPALSRPLYQLFHRDRRLSPAAGRFVDFLEGSTAES
ncbi:LysR family transcriptional regulator [Marinobacter sp. R17]|uniref:LysR family transcriptional regulator n=1 Tax=Marinobacter sp. R17 TaxID=2484250 RepID=UPI000F4B0537|nr:LysR family transcriptional regulator [Marinobacter sp. R17]ROU02311.1 LysR family transcriptional regulator [Marinobacter sp. R17]